MQPRLIIFGLDGATFDVMKPWLKAGDLPNIERIMNQGSHATLRSTIHPLTPVAWSSFMTGRNPGKHGMFNFRHRPRFTYHPEFLNGGHLRAHTLWSYLNASGHKVGVVNVPFTYPPHQVDGYMISGMDAPSVSPQMFRPRELYHELLAATGEYQIGPDFIVEGKVDRGQLALQVQNRGAAARYLLSRRPVDVFMIVFTATDHIQHYCWPLSEHPADRRVQGLEMIRHAYQLVDSEIGKCLALASETPDVVLMSDHGFGASSRCLSLGRWLADNGYLTLNEGGANRSRPHPARFSKYMPKKLRSRLRQHLEHRQPSVIAHLSMVNWSRTRAFATGTYGNVWINLRGRDPDGCVEPGQEYEQLRQELIAGIGGIRDPGNGEALIEKVYRREELYQGPFLDYAPDLIVVPREYNIEISPAYTARELIERRPPDKRGCLRSGDHRLNGIFAAAGPHIKKLGRVEALSILDVAPTLMAMLGVPIPADMDGEVATHIFRDVETPSYELDRGEWDLGGTADPGGSYSPDEREIIADRLRGLGYL